MAQIKSLANRVRTSTAPGVMRSRILCGAAVALYWAALEVYLPTLPTYIAERSGALAQVGAILAMYGLSQTLVRFPLGILSDWVGRRKPFVIAGMILAAMGALMLGYAQGTPALYVGRTITGLAGAAWVPLLVMFSALFPPEESVRATAMVTLIGSAARTVATSATGWLNDWGGYRLAFQIAAFLAAVGIVALLPSSDPRRDPQPPNTRAILRLVTRPDVLLPSLVAFASQFAMWGSTFSFNPIMARELGRRFGARALTYAGLGMLCGGIVLVAVAPSVTWVLVAQAVIGFSQGIGYPVLVGLSIRHVDDIQRTSAMGLHQMIYALGMFGGPAACGLLADAFGLRAMFCITAALALLAGLGLMRLLVRRVPQID